MDNLTLNDHLDMLGHALSTEACIIRSYLSYNQIQLQYKKNSRGGPIHVQNYGKVYCPKFCGYLQLQTAMDKKFGFFSDQKSQSSSQFQEKIQYQNQSSFQTQSSQETSKHKQTQTSSMDDEQLRSIDVTLGTGAAKLTITMFYYNFETVGQVVERVVQNFQEKTNNKSLQGYLVKDGIALQNNRTMEYYNIKDTNELQLFPKLLGGVGGNSQGSDLAVEVYFLTADSLSPKHNFNYQNVRQGANFGTRGGVPYDVPSGWMGIALNINKFPENDWLGMSNQEGEWAVVYHGTKHQFVNRIVDEGLRPGQHNGVGQGALAGEFRAIFSSPYVNYCTRERYSEPYYHEKSGQTYQQIFQCRINHKLSQDQFQIHCDNNEWLCDTGCIRPYRLLIRQVHLEDVPSRRFFHFCQIM